LEVAFENKSGNSFSLLNNSKLLEMARQVNLSMGSDKSRADVNINLMKNEETAKLSKFVECNPKITLPVNLDVSINAEEFPPLVNITKSPLLRGSSLEIGEKSWAKIVGQNLVNSKISHNDRSLLEC